jgi:hypothetical protein
VFLALFSNSCCSATGLIHNSLAGALSQAGLQLTSAICQRLIHVVSHSQADVRPSQANPLCFSFARVFAREIVFLATESQQ